MRHVFIAALALAALATSSAAKADVYQFYTDQGQQVPSSVSTGQLDEQAVSTQTSDPTARDSIRSHGRP